jgi:phosphomannomutase/phosphoglucomutase
MALRTKAAPAPEDTAAVQAAPAAAAVAGKGLFGYFLLPVLLGVVLLVALAGLSVVALDTARRANAEEAADQVARILAQQAAETVAGARDLLRYMAGDPRVAEAVSLPQAARRGVAGQLGSEALAFLQVRILPAGWDSTDPTGDAPLGYAGIDLLRRVLREGQRLAEVHQVQGPRPYIALVEAIGGQSGTAPGALFGALPLSRLERPLLAVPERTGRFWLTQEVGGERVALGQAAGSDARAGGHVAVANTTLAVAYAGAAPALLDAAALPVLAAAAFGVVLLVLLGWIQARRLGSDIRHDMGIAVASGEAILKGQPAARGENRVGATGDALLLLAQYAQQARVAETASPRPAATAPSTADDGRPPPARVVVHERRDDAMIVEEMDELPEAPRGSAAAGGERGLPRHVFRAYDIRGKAETDFDAHDVALLGRALGTLVKERGGDEVAVARDVRVSSRQLADALVDGLTAAGCSVVDLGLVPTPVLYFARYSLEVDAAVMVTGSHNPPEYNGFKIVLGDEVLAGKPLAGLREKMTNEALASGTGSVREMDLGPAYLEHILGDVALGREYKIVVDAGNGVAGHLAVSLLEALGCDVVPLFCQPDGRFPNHHPDPGRPENLEALIEEVKASEADLGIAFDGDGDRLGVVDDQGNPVAPDRVLMQLAMDVLVRNPGVDILYDVKSSRHLAGFILANGGRPIMWRSGHARMRAKLQQTGALLAGEFAGHYFIKERWFGFDDALYAAARLLESLSADPRQPAEIFADLPISPGTPELHLPLPEGRSPAVMQQLGESAAFGEAKLIDIDGLRIEFADGWGLVRPSNTEPGLTLRFEGDSPEAIARIQGEFKNWLLAADASLKLPF